MATATEQKTLCSICQKASGIFKCRGCTKDFCFRHVSEHRQELNKQMDELTTDHDQLRQTITEQEVKPNRHPLMKNIDEWEQQSINTILQTADDARKRLLTIIGQYRTEVTNDLSSLTTELNKARDEDDYIETDLKEWSEKLDALKIDLNAAQIINFAQSNDQSVLIPKFQINDASADIFHQITGDVTIMEGGRAILHGATQKIVAARCRGEYSSGQHRFCFKIEQLSGNNGFSCGIVSKNTPTTSIFNTNVQNNMYGHHGAYSTYQCLNHSVVSSFHEQNYTFQMNDTYELLIDCKHKRIHLTNEQTRYTSPLDVNLSTFPFPWQFFITFTFPNDRVSLC
jgi:outer membrane murein-binding lipoprotein Lpp